MVKEKLVFCALCKKQLPDQNFLDLLKSRPISSAIKENLCDGCETDGIMELRIWFKKNKK